MADAFTHADIVGFEPLLMAVRWRTPTATLVVHSDQGSQFTSHVWREFLTCHNLEASMSRRATRYDNAVAQSFFHLLKTKRIRRKTYKIRTGAPQGVFDDIELFYNLKRRQAKNGMLSPVQFELAAM